MKNKFISIILSVMILAGVVSVNAFAAYDNVNASISMGRVHIKGTLPENSGKNISILCVDKGTDVTGEIAKEKIVYIDEIDNITNNEFEIAFNAETSIENIDIYINDSVFMEENPSTKSKLINIKDYADNYYFDAELNVDVLKKFTEYGIEANIKNIFGYEDVSCDILIACYAKDGKLLQVTKEGHNNYAQPYEEQLIVPEGTWSAKAYVWVNNKPITQSKVIDKNINPVKYNGTNADAAGYREITEETFIKANEPWFEYNGRWQADGENMISNWQRAYVKVAVEGKNITLNFAERGSYTRGRLIINGKLADWHIMLNNNEDNATNPNSADVNIDLSAKKYSSYMSDEYNEIVIMSKSEGTRVGFKGMTVGEGSIVYKPIAKDLNMMFVGDSITAWSNDNSR